MTPELKALIERLEELESKATAGPWSCRGGIYVYSSDSMMVADNNDDEAVIRARGVGGGMSTVQQTDNITFVAAARNALPLLLQIVKVQGEALEKIASGRTTDDDEPNKTYAIAGYVCQEIARQALKECGGEGK